MLSTTKTLLENLAVETDLFGVKLKIIRRGFGERSYNLSYTARTCPDRSAARRFRCLACLRVQLLQRQIFVNQPKLAIIFL